jgi:hypothetical protein
MELVNIHFAAPSDMSDKSDQSDMSDSPPAAAEARLRLRKVNVSPHEEYAMRAGEVRPISDALAALICCRKGRAEIGPKGITVERKDIGGKRIYHHVDSKLCNDLSQRERKIYYVLNSLKPEVIHLLDDTGRYLESLPEKFQPGVLNTEEQAREYADQKRQVSRVARHLQELHGKDTEDAIATLTRNADMMKGIVQVLGIDDAAPVREPAPSPLGERVLAADRHHQDLRRQRRDILNLGHAVSRMVRETTPVSAGPEDSEEWNDSPVRTQTTRIPTPQPIESW